MSSIAFLAFLYLLGFFCFPRLIFNRTDFSVSPFFCGAGLFILICWYGMHSDYSLFNVFKFMSVAIVILACFRLSWLRLPYLLSHISIRTLVIWLITYVAFYIMACTFFPQPSSQDILPILRHAYSDDILNYIDITAYLTHLGTPNISEYAHSSMLYLVIQTPALFYFYALFSVFFHQDLLLAAMPLVYTITALIGVMITRYGKRLFALSHGVSFAIAAIIIAGSAYQSVMGYYFLSALMAVIPLFYLLMETAKLGAGVNDYQWSEYLMRILCLSVPALLVILYLSFILFVIAIVLQGLLIILVLACSFSKNTVKVVPKKLLLNVIGLVLSVVVLILLNTDYIINTFKWTFTNSTVNYNWWTLSFSSPFVMLGLPSPILHSSRAIEIAALLFSVVMAFVAYFIFRLPKDKKLSLDAQAFFWLSLIILLFSTFNDQYRWLSYYALFLAGSVWGGIASILIWRDAFVFAWKNTLAIALCGLIILGGGDVQKKQAEYEKLSGKYNHLDALDHLAVSALWIKMTNYSSTLLPIYFIPHQKLHLVNPDNSASYYALGMLDFDAISPKKPFFMETQGDCKGVDATQVIKLRGLGCLYLTAPTVNWNKVYDFNNTPLFIETSGLAIPESWGGRWTIEKLASITLYMDARTLNQHPNGFIHFKIHPFIYPHLDGQEVRFRWGNHSLIHNFKDTQWISLPYKSTDWTKLPAGKIQKMIIHFELPDAMSPHQIQPASTSDERLLGVGFVNLLINQQA